MLINWNGQAIGVLSKTVKPIHGEMIYENSGHDWQMIIKQNLEI